MNICFKSRTMDLSWSLAVWAYRETKNEKLAWVFARSVEQTFKKEKAQTSNEQKSVAPIAASNLSHNEKVQTLPVHEKTQTPTEQKSLVQIVAGNLSFAEIRGELFLRFLKEVWETNDYVYEVPTLSQRRKLKKSVKIWNTLNTFKYKSLLN